MRKLLQSLFILMFVAGAAMAQDRTVTGTVTGKDDGLPIPGVSVKIVGTANGTSTDANGKYALKVAAGQASIEFSSLGYLPVIIPVASSNVVNVVLGTDTRQLGEVVVTAMGITRTAKSLGYSVTTVKGDDLTKARETNVINSLAGKVAGVRVTSQSGTVGGSAKIIIRGASSFNSGSTSNQPIFVIDGLPVDNGAPQVNTIPTSSVPQGSAGSDYGNRAGDLNSDDIESVTVLKGAAATALYGARAKNGAIVITTKKGKKGQGSVTFNSSTRFDDILKLPDFQNEYAQGNQGVYNANNALNSPNVNGWGPKISEVQDMQFTNYLNQRVTLQAYPDNVKDFYNTGKTYINSVAFEGGGESGDYRFGFTNTTQNGIIPNEQLRKNVLSLNAGRTVLPGLDIRTNVNYTRTAADGRPVQSSNNPSVLQSVVYGLPRTLDIGVLKNNYVDPITGQQITLTAARNGNNPYWIVNNNNFSNVVDRVYGNGIVTYKPLSWLSISDNLGTDFYNEYRKGVTRQGTIGSLTGDFYAANIYNRIINNDFIITADHKLTEDLSLKVIAGYNVFESFYRRDLTDAQQLTIDGLYNYANAASVVTTNTSNKKRIQGVYGDVGLSYKDYLFLNVTGRNDWSSTLPVSNRSYFYPSVSSSFVFSEVVPKSDWFNYGKLRASYANVGSDTDPYQGAYTYAPIAAAFAQYGYGSTFPFNGVLAFSSPATIPNLTLKPQNQASFEVGTELRFLNNRVNLDFTYYNSKTSDQIVSLPLPQSTGFSAALRNAGSVKNTGVEVTLGLVPLKTTDFTWNLDINFSKNNQKIELPKELASYPLASGWSGLSIKAESGKSFGIYGTAWSRDASGNLIIDPATGLRQVKSEQRLGNMTPDWLGGISNTFSYKGASLSFLVDMRKGGVIFSNTASSLRVNGLAKETLLNRGNIFIDKGVNPNGAVNTTPVTSMQEYWAQYGTTNTEANIFDASYVKLREVRLSYQLPSRFLQRNVKFFKSAEIGIEGRNLWIIHDNVPHIDPEANFFGSDSVAEGVEFNSVPSTRTIGFNLRVKI
ncbi:MAG: SusC/RagA family TonB-linked outer membrane protein [Candidatus Pedobacter colombiensis]|uniref:SusC/RagA family TonB-linked outer membrane protein n=1 Tax=Candidatus Pedobacter colombiensis TaxID=3121371 RepID=A0AAJ6B8R0_9SPHI|nr:SusC/RagA family TonB-linked outer membrane protein [Pedobacter sp.]WEK19398.1 MAG: SusC/RagA family TonB-linked outer membrane protein [Pedobacter sp.]